MEETIEPTLLKSFSVKKGSILCANPYGVNHDVACGMGNGNVVIIPNNSNLNVTKLVGHQKDVTCMCFSHSETQLATGSLDQSVRIWVGNKGGDSFAIASPGEVNSIATSFTFDRLLVDSGLNNLSLYDSKLLSKIQTLSSESLSKINCVSMSFDGVLALAGDSSGQFSLFDTRTGSIASSINTGTSLIKCTAFRENGSAVACGCENGVVVLWDTRTKHLISNSELSNSSVNSIDFHPAKPLLLAGCEDSSVSVCNANDRKNLFTLKHHTAGVSNVRWSFDGSTFTSCGNDRKVVLWSEPRIDRIRELDHPKPNVHHEVVNETFQPVKTAPKPIDISQTHEINKPQPNISSTISEDEETSKRFANTMHIITDQIAKLSRVLSKMEERMDRVDEQIAILEAEKRADALKVLRASKGKLH